MNNLINDNFIFDLILGSLLGDGSIEKPSGLSKEYTISFHQSKEKESKYIKLKHDIISTKFNINNIRPGNNNTLRFSLSHRLTKDKEFTEMIRPLVRDIDNNRIFPDINLVTPVVLLFWYLDDGSFPISKQIRKSGKINIHRKIKITLQSYKDEDIIRFTELLNDKFDLNFKTSTQIIKNQIKITDIIISNNIRSGIIFFIRLTASTELSET